MAKKNQENNAFVDDAKEKFENLHGKLDELGDTIAEITKKYPLQTLAAAAVVGFLAAQLLRRKDA